ncbi:MAG: FAD-dependent oxidoreductase [Chloroflexi bacterium]|nr:FAD-dependent oxidoreductase [Chloroflexota bacterium]
MTTDFIYDLAIAGQGAAGYAAALYAARYQIHPIVLGGTFGGETATGGLIENYPGFPEIDGFELMLKFREQAEKYEVPIVDEDVASIAKESDCFALTTDESNTYKAASVIIAVGRERRKLRLEHEDEWTGKGVSFCSTCDAPLHRDNVVGVVGGGDAAIKGAVLLGKYARQVYIIYRGDRFTRPEAVNLRQMEDSPNVQPVFNINVVELKGEDGLSGVVLDNQVNGSNELSLDGLFIEIGADPRGELAKQLGAAVNELGEIEVDNRGRTSVEGVFAAGDVTDASGDLKQTITAAAQGAVAATTAYEYISEHGNACALHAVGYKVA